MIKLSEKYGEIHINGKNIEIDKTDLTELNIYLDQLEKKREQLIEKQNELISKIIG